MMKSERGFTLVEAIVALVVSTIGLLTLAQMMAVTLQMQQLGRNSTSAARMAQDKVDELTTVGFTDPSMQCGGSLTADVANYNDTPDGVTNYKRRWVVANGPDGAGSSLNLRQVTVRVIPELTDRRVASPFDLTTIIRYAGPGAVACP
jgi:type II secretory pathway pseudopilin PulG